MLQEFAKRYITMVKSFFFFKLLSDDNGGYTRNSAKYELSDGFINYSLLALVFTLTLHFDPGFCPRSLISQTSVQRRLNKKR